MPGEALGNNQNQEKTDNAANAWEQTMAEYRKAVADAEAEMPVVEPQPAATATEDLAGSQQAGNTARSDRYYVIGKGVAETPETKANGTAKPETRLYLDPRKGEAVVQAVQVGEVEVPQSEALGAQEDTAEGQEAGEKDAGGRENLDAWLESIKGTPEEYWQRLAAEKSEKGVELGEMPDLAKVDKAIRHFFDDGLVGVTGEARAVRETMAKKAILNDIAKLKERGGELNDETMRNVFYGTQRMLEEMYRGNRELREDAQEAELSPDEEIAWHLKMEPRRAKVNVLLVMQQNTRRPGEGSDAYEARLRNYAEDTLEHREQLKRDQEYNTKRPDEAAEYVAQVLKNGQRDDLPEFKYLSWDEVDGDGAAEEAAAVEETDAAETEKPVEREGRVKRLFEKVRGKIGFQKVVDKVMTKVAGAIVGAVTWAEGVLAEEPTKADAVDANGDVVAEPRVETEHEKRLKDIEIAKAETMKRMAKAQNEGDSAKVLHWAELLMKLEAKAKETEAEGAEVLAA